MVEMRIYDCMFGMFEIPKYLDKLLTSPEFRRLSEVRMININSPSLSSLSETKRYSHTLGVLRLALANPMLGFDQEERKALLAAIIIHDAATPAFAHLFEYFLADRFSWDHEMAIPDLLSEGGEIDRLSTQIYFSQTPKFLELCKSARIDFDIVMSIVRGQHPLSRLVFGSIDFDNLDNVARMNWMLGADVDKRRLLHLAENLGASAKAALVLPKAQQKDVQYWLNLRRNAYQVLVFDHPTVAAQAVLSKAIRIGLELGDLDLEDWLYSDYKMIEVLRESSLQTKKMLDNDFLGPLPSICLLYHFQDTTHRIFDRSRDEIVSLVEEFLSDRQIGGRVYAYTFRDKGAFSKRVEAVDPVSGESWSVGDKSDSLLVYGFTSKKGSWHPIELGESFVSWVDSK